MATLKRLVYWYAGCINDHDTYSIVARTKREAANQRREMGAHLYEPPVKKVIEYRDAFELFEMVTGEGGGRGYSNVLAKVKS